MNTLYIIFPYPPVVHRSGESSYFSIIIIIFNVYKTSWCGHMYICSYFLPLALLCKHYDKDNETFCWANSRRVGGAMKRTILTTHGQTYTNIT